MNRWTEQYKKSILLLVDGGRLLSMGILQHKHRDIDEILVGDQIHTKIRVLRDFGRISDEHFQLLFPPTDLSQWDATITSRFLKHCTDLEEPHRRIMDELYELRNKAMDMNKKEEEIVIEECTSVWTRIVNILQRGKTLLTGPIVVDIDETIYRIEQSPVTPEDMDRVKSWYDLETNYEDTETCYGDTTEGKSVVHDAAFHGKLSTLKYVRQKFPDRLQEQDKKGNQAVHLAAERGHTDCLRYICESFPEFKELRNQHEMDALHCAACGGCVDCLKYLIGQGMKTDTRSKQGLTILHEAVYGGSMSMVHYIYETFPALTKEMNEKGQDALFTAARSGNLNCLKYLIDQGMNTDTRSKNGNTLLHEAAFRGSVSTVMYLCETFPELKKGRNEKGHDALHSAALGSRLECVKYLVGQGMNTERGCNPEYTLLYEAAYGGSVSVVKYIWETFPDLRYERNEKGMDALFGAAIGGSINCLQYLISEGMNTETRSKFGSTVLNEAAFNGSESIVQYICETFPELKNERNEIGQDALHSAARGGSLDCLIYMIGQCMNTDTRSKNGDTLLHEAAYGGSLSIVRYILKTFPRLKTERNAKGRDALCSAALGESLECFKYLISQGMKTDTRCENGNTLLQDAAYGGSVSMVQYILKTFPELTNERNSKREDALYNAAIGGSLKCFKYLITLGMNTDTRSENGYTLLHAAAYGGSMSMVQYIWETFTDLQYETSKMGKDALHSAVRGGNIDCVKYLIGHGMNKDTRSENGDTLLHAAAYGRSVTMVRYIWETFPELNKERNKIGQDALYSVACGGNLDSFKYLISQGMEIDTQSKYGQSILHQAVYYGHELVVQYLCENYNQYFDYEQAYGQQLIFAAVCGGHLDILKYLLSLKIDPELPNRKGHTILHAAARNGKTDIVRYLCTTHRFLIPLKATKGETARELAHRNRRFDCVQELEKRF